MNKVVLVGRLTKDPELKRTNSDIPYVQFTLAVNRPYANKGGDRQADFINCIVWRAPAENLARFIRKGGLVGVDGMIQTRTYDDQNGVRHYITEVVCDNVTFLEAKKDGAGDMQQGYGYQQAPQSFNQPSYSSYNQQNVGYQGSSFNQPNSFNQQAGYNQNSAYRGANPNQGATPQSFEQKAYNQNAKAAPKQQDPFEDIDDSFNISSDDLPF